MHVTSPAMPLGHAACLYSLCILYCLICNYKYMFSVTSKSSLDRGVPFSGILNLWNSFLRNSGAGCDSLLLTVTCVQRDCQRKPTAKQRKLTFVSLTEDALALLTWGRFLCFAFFQPGRYLRMGTESGFVKHERVSNSLDFPSGTPDEQKSSSWLCLLVTHILYNTAMEARTWQTHLFLFLHFPAKWPFFLMYPSVNLVYHYITVPSRGPKWDQDCA